MHDDNIDKEMGDAKNPEIISFYNCTKGVVDEMAVNYSQLVKEISGH